MLASRKTYVGLSVLVLLLVSVCSCGAGSNAATNESDELRLSRLRVDLEQAQVESRMIAVRTKEGLASSTDLMHAEIKVESLRARLARHEEDWTRALDSLSKVVAGQKRILDLERRMLDEGACAARDVNVSRIDLSQTQVLYELMTIISIRQSDVDRTTGMVDNGIAPQLQLLRAKDELNKACGLYDDMCERFKR